MPTEGPPPPFPLSAREAACAAVAAGLRVLVRGAAAAARRSERSVFRPRPPHRPCSIRSSRCRERAGSPSQESRCSRRRLFLRCPRDPDNHRATARAILSPAVIELVRRGVEVGIAREREARATRAAAALTGRAAPLPLHHRSRRTQLASPIQTRHPRSHRFLACPKCPSRRNPAPRRLARLVRSRRWATHDSSARSARDTSADECRTSLDSKGTVRQILRCRPVSDRDPLRRCICSFRRASPCLRGRNSGARVLRRRVGSVLRRARVGELNRIDAVVAFSARARVDRRTFDRQSR